MTVQRECHCHLPVGYDFGPDMPPEELDRCFAQYHDEDCPERLRLVGCADCVTSAEPTLLGLSASLLVHELHRSLRAQRDQLRHFENIARALTVAIITRRIR